MQRAGRDPVQIRKIFSANRAEAVQVEVRIAKLERIEGPLNEANATAQSFFALKQFEPATNAAVAIVGVDAGHVRVEEGLAIAQTNQCECIADKPVAIKRAKYLAAGVCRNDEYGGGLDFQVLLAPDFALEIHATMELFERLTFAHNDVLDHFRAWASDSSLKPDFPSVVFAAFHRRSEEHTSELQSLRHLVCRLLLEKKKNTNYQMFIGHLQRLPAPFLHARPA